MGFMRQGAPYFVQDVVPLQRVIDPLNPFMGEGVSHLKKGQGTQVPRGVQG